MSVLGHWDGAPGFRRVYSHGNYLPRLWQLVCQSYPPILSTLWQREDTGTCRHVQVLTYRQGIGREKYECWTRSQLLCKKRPISGIGKWTERWLTGIFQYSWKDENVASARSIRVKGWQMQVAMELRLRRLAWEQSMERQIKRGDSSPDQVPALICGSTRLDFEV